MPVIKSFINSDRYDATIGGVELWNPLFIGNTPQNNIHLKSKTVNKF